MSVQVLNRKTKEVQATPQSLQNFYLLCKPEDKLALLLNFLKVRTGASGPSWDAGDAFLQVTRAHVAAESRFGKTGRNIRTTR